MDKKNASLVLPITVSAERVQEILNKAGKVAVPVPKLGTIAEPEEKEEYQSESSISDEEEVPPLEEEHTSQEEEDSEEDAAGSEDVAASEDAVDSEDVEEEDKTTPEAKQTCPLYGCKRTTPPTDLEAIDEKLKYIQQTTTSIRYHQRLTANQLDSLDDRYEQLEKQRSTPRSILDMLVNNVITGFALGVVFSFLQSPPTGTNFCHYHGGSGFL